MMFVQNHIFEKKIYSLLVVKFFFTFLNNTTLMSYIYRSNHRYRNIKSQSMEIN